MKKIQQGFSLIEVLVVVVILAILAAIVVPKIMSRPEQARMVKAKQDVLAIDNAMEMYKLDNGFYPSQAQGIAALIKAPTTDPKPMNYAEGGYLQNMPVDPWGHAYQFQNPGKHDDIDIFSYGPSGKPGAHEIGNWNVSGQAK